MGLVQTADTFRLDGCIELALNQQTLGGATNPGHTGKTVKIEIGLQTNRLEGEVKVAAITDWLADNKANVQAQRMSRRDHSVPG